MITLYVLGYILIAILTAWIMGRYKSDFDPMWGLAWPLFLLLLPFVLISHVLNWAYKKGSGER